MSNSPTKTGHYNHTHRAFLRGIDGNCHSFTFFLFWATVWHHLKRWLINLYCRQHFMVGSWTNNFWHPCTYLSIFIFSLIEEKLSSTLDTMLQSSLNVTSIVHCLYVTWTIIDEKLKTIIWFSFICLVFKEGPRPTWSMTKGCQSLLWQMEYT